MRHYTNTTTRVLVLGVKHFSSSEEDELCDAMESAFAVCGSRQAQSWQMTSKVDRFGMRLPMKSLST